MFNATKNLLFHLKTNMPLLMAMTLSAASTIAIGQSLSPVEVVPTKFVPQLSVVETTPTMQNPFTRSPALIIAQAAQPENSTGSPSNSAAGPVLPTDEHGGTASGKSTVRALVDDSIVTTKIKAAMLADPGVKATEVSVETNSGEVTLSGAVDSQPALEQAEKIAKKVAGVKTVVNNLRLKK